MTKTIALAVLFFVLPATLVANRPRRTMNPVGYPASSQTPTKRPHLSSVSSWLISTVPMMGGIIATDPTISRAFGSFVCAHPPRSVKIACRKERGIFMSVVWRDVNPNPLMMMLPNESPPEATALTNEIRARSWIFGSKRASRTCSLTNVLLFVPVLFSTTLCTATTFSSSVSHRAVAGLSSTTTINSTPQTTVKAPRIR